jgi:hypothetical protein
MTSKLPPSHAPHLRAVSQSIPTTRPSGHNNNRGRLFYIGIAAIAGGVFCCLFSLLVFFLAASMSISPQASIYQPEKSAAGLSLVPGTGSLVGKHNHVMNCTGFEIAATRAGFLIKNRDGFAGLPFDLGMIDHPELVSGMGEDPLDFPGKWAL